MCPVFIQTMAEWEVCIVRSASFHLHAGWFSNWFVNPWRGSCFHKTNLQRGNRRSHSDAISSLAKQINFVCIFVPLVAKNVLHVTAMEKYFCTSPLNKTNFFTLPEPRDLRDNLTCFDLHKSLYGFEPRAVELLLRSWPWNLILEDIKMIGLGFLCFCHRRESAMNIVLILVFLLWLNGSFVGLGCLFTAFWPRFKPKHSQMSVFSVVLQLDYTEELFECKKRIEWTNSVLIHVGNSLTQCCFSSILKRLSYCAVLCHATII